MMETEMKHTLKNFDMIFEDIMNGGNGQPDYQEQGYFPEASGQPIYKYEIPFSDMRKLYEQGKIDFSRNPRCVKENFTKYFTDPTCNGIYGGTATNPETGMVDAYVLYRPQRIFPGVIYLTQADSFVKGLGKTMISDLINRAGSFFYLMSNPMAGPGLNNYYSGMTNDGQNKTFQEYRSDAGHNFYYVNKGLDQEQQLPKIFAILKKY